MKGKTYSVILMNNQEETQKDRIIGMIEIPDT